MWINYFGYLATLVFPSRHCPSIGAGYRWGLVLLSFAISRRILTTYCYIMRGISNSKIKDSNRMEIGKSDCYSIAKPIIPAIYHQNKKYVSYWGMIDNLLLDRSNLVKGHFCHQDSPSIFIVSMFIISLGNSSNSKLSKERVPVWKAFFIFITNALFDKNDFETFFFTSTTN